MPLPLHSFRNPERVICGVTRRSDRARKMRPGSSSRSEVKGQASREMGPAVQGCVSVRAGRQVRLDRRPVTTPAFVLVLVSGGFLMVLWSDAGLCQAAREIRDAFRFKIVDKGQKEGK